MWEFYTFYKKNTKSALLFDTTLCKTLLGETGFLGNPYFTGCLSIQFFDSPLPPPSTLTQSVRLPTVTYPSLCSPCVPFVTRCFPPQLASSLTGYFAMSPALHSGFSGLKASTSSELYPDYF